MKGLRGIGSLISAWLGLLILLAFPLTALADPDFNHDLFKAKWERADKPVAAGLANPKRSWLWGPESFKPGPMEPYAESSGGVREVLYFDKARMELNDPASGIVTNGLLVRELISGKMATGNSAFSQRRAAEDIPVAGDPSGNTGPTYASFAKVASTNNDNPSPDRTGQPVTGTINLEGATGTNQSLGGFTSYIYFESILKHNIPEVFWSFMNQQGNVYLDGQLKPDQPVLGDNPYAPWLDATGYPISEAYWATVTVAGIQKPVLIQMFERRVLTFTPDNPEAFKVEMGNVGRHYFNWRYDNRYEAVRPANTGMSTARYGHAATLLPDGKVLVAGGIGQNETELFSSCELFDPASGTWSLTGEMASAQIVPTLTLLPDGKVLLVGINAELYDPATGNWRAAGSLADSRTMHTATLLPNGQVLVAGGFMSKSGEQLYDPVTGNWSATGKLTYDRSEHTATLLPNGKVLVAGGQVKGGSEYLASAELYDPATGVWSKTGDMTGTRAFHTATLLPNGRVLVAGGFGTGMMTAELYDPATGKWTGTGNMLTGHILHTATLLASGKVLVAGGGLAGKMLVNAELYDPATGKWKDTGSMITGRMFHTATLLASGKVLVAGGGGIGPTLASSELYDPATGSWRNSSGK